MALSNRLKKTRLVEFNDDYIAGGRVIYKAGEKHYVHQALADKLKGAVEGTKDNKKPGKLKISKFDEEKIEKAKEAFEAARKKEAAGE